MKKKLLFAAIALTAMASCTEDSFVGEQSQQEANASEGAISFNLNVPAVTRANKTGAEAATDLNQHFIVWGEKNEAQGNSGADGKGKAEATNLVFQNYQVNWTANSAFTTTSNTENWEYVGFTHTAKHQSNITTKDEYGSPAATTALTSAQTIKYWDWGASSYTFTAVSADKNDIDADKVTIKKLTSDNTDVYGKGYEINIAAWSGDAPTPPAKYTAEKVFIADRKLITKTESGSNTDRTQDNKYGGNVTLTFRNILTHVRVGMYETVPGYTVTINSFTYKNDGTPTNFGAMKETGHTATSTTNFVANAANVAIGSAAKLTVTYQKSGSVVNQPTITVGDATVATHLSLGTNIPGTALGETATTARFDQSSENTYTSFFPQEANTVSLKLMVNYTLTSPTGETITVTDATAEIPAQYLQWKPNYKYTYLFKISDNTNGSTGTPGTDPAGLYPITFDAVETIADDGKAEYITTVSEPSITTFGVNSSTNKYVTGGSEYAAGTVVYATVMDGSTLATLSSSNMNLYTVTGTGVITEAGVAEHLIEKPTMTKAQVDAATVVPAASSFTNYANTVPAEDGTTITLDASDAKAAFFTTAASTKYAIVYMNTAPTYYVSTGATYADAAAFATAKSAAIDGKLYSDEACTSEAASWTDASTNYYQINGKTYTSEQFTAAGMLYTDAACTSVAASWTEGTPYYKPTRVKTQGVYAIKIVNCP